MNPEPPCREARRDGHLRSIRAQSLAGLLAAVSVAGLVTWGEPSAPTFSAPQVLVVLSNPFAVTTDLAGNVLVMADNVTSQILRLYTPSGGLLQSRAVGDFSTFSGSRLDTDRATGEILQLTSAGELYRITSPSLDRQLLVNVKELNVDWSEVYDLKSNQVRNLTGAVRLQDATFGDLAAVSRDGQSDWLISGRVEVTGPFILRVRRRADASIGAKALVTSRLITAADPVRFPRGVAVNPQGTALTTLPMFEPTGLHDVGVAFLPEGPGGPGSALPRVVVTGSFPSSGMTADPRGNFYVVGGALGALAPVFLSADFAASVTLTAPAGAELSPLDDVAVSPDGRILYALYGEWLGTGQPGRIVRYDVTLPPLPAAFHTADYRDPKWVIDATEAARVLAYWRQGSYHADPAGHEGYAPGPGPQGGQPHAADYREPRWVIDATEASRVLGYWRGGGYHSDPAGLDGYAPGREGLRTALMPRLTPPARQDQATLTTLDTVHNSH